MSIEAEVILALREDKSITKKKACEMLNISYNVKRLDKILDEYEHRVARDAKLRKGNVRKPLSTDDKSYIIKERIAGTTISEISKNIYHSLNKVKNFILEETPLPIRDIHDPLDYEELNEDFLRLSYKVGDLVYSSKYGCCAKVCKCFSKDVYRVYLLGSWEQYAYQEVCELGDMTSLVEEYNLVINSQKGVAPALKLVRKS